MQGVPGFHGEPLGPLSDRSMNLPEASTPVRTKLIRAAIVVVAAAVVLLAYLLVAQRTQPDPAVHVAPKELLKTPLTGSDPFSDQYVKELKRYYGATISEKGTQASLVGLRDYFVAMQSDKGASRFRALLRRAFPDHAGDIMETLAKLDQYDRWLEDNRDMLLRMGPEERLDALWKKRMELFGEDAREIWSGEMLATEARRAKVQDTLAALNDADGTTMDDKLDLYRAVIHETYENTPEGYVLEHKELLSKVFFSIDAVQDELKRMSPGQRRQEVNRIRRNMGMTDEQIDAMAKRDADRELRWEIGMQYMKDRDAAEQVYQGPELVEKLKELREQYFDDEAGTIELEEKDGFFRFKRPHIYGRN